MEQHGEYRIEKQGQILMVNVKGPWNTEFIINYTKDMETTICQMDGQSWANLAFVHGLGLMTPDAEQQFVTVMKRRQALGLQCVAVIVCEADGRSVVEAQLVRIFQQADIPCCFFLQAVDAYRWLAGLGFSRSAS